MMIAETIQTSLGAKAMHRLQTLAEFSEPGPGVTRIFASPEHKAAVSAIGGWMAEAGMQWRLDDIANIVGHYPGTSEQAPTLILGSHQDTVREGGKFDGAMGVILPLICVDWLHQQGQRLPFAIDVVAFGDEEGVRYGTTLLGSKALAGTFDMAVLETSDADGITMRQALKEFGCQPDNIPNLRRHRQNVIGYIECHIEQGPMLEAWERPVGVVTSIVHGIRLGVTIQGSVGHAGTVPMKARSDALCAAAECTLAVERLAQEAGNDAVSTVGMLEVKPGSINVIPGEVNFSIDMRAPTAGLLKDLQAETARTIEAISAARGVNFAIEEFYNSKGCSMAPGLTQVLEQAMSRKGIEPIRLPSGAGHDAMAMHDLCDVAMMFVRCAGGISHSPYESVTADDLGAAAATLLDALTILARQYDG